MTALVRARGVRERKISFFQFVLKTSDVAYPGASICWDTVNLVATVATATATLRYLGTCSETLTITGDGSKKINVQLPEEVSLTFFENGTAGDAIASTDRFASAYLLDDQTVSIAPAGKTLAGEIWDVDSLNGIGVRLSASGSRSLQPQPSVAAFTTGSWAPALIINGGSYDVPTTAANSTIVLPTAAPDGTIAYFTADGTKNGHTITYVDQAGTTSISAALTASKRHFVVAHKRLGKWFVSPTTTAACAP